MENIVLRQKFHILGISDYLEVILVKTHLKPTGLKTCLLLHNDSILPMLKKLRSLCIVFSSEKREKYKVLPAEHYFSEFEHFDKHYFQAKSSSQFRYFSLLTGDSSQNTLETKNTQNVFITSQGIYSVIC